jgi:hypothetical protein
MLKVVAGIGIVFITYYYATKIGYEIWKAKLKDI